MGTKAQHEALRGEAAHRIDPVSVHVAEAIIRSIQKPIPDDDEAS